MDAIEKVKANGGNLHVVGLFGPGGVHSHSDHMFAIFDMANAQGIDPVLHMITDGRDTPPESSEDFLVPLEAYQKEKNVTVASVGGRYYTMDRDKRWQRTVMGYDVIAKHEGHEGRTAVTAREAIEAAHAEGVTDEFVFPVAIDCDRDVTIQPGDAVLFYNFRADRMHQLLTAFSFDDFDGFEREFIRDLNILTITNYNERYQAQVLFPEIELVNVLAEVVSNEGLKQFHAAETEKYAHVTYFFNGGAEKPFAGEERHLGTIAQSGDL